MTYRQEEQGGPVRVKDSIQDETNENSEYFGKVVPGGRILNEELRQQGPDGEEQLQPSWEDKPRPDI